MDYREAKKLVAKGLNPFLNQVFPYLKPWNVELRTIILVSIPS